MTLSQVPSGKYCVSVLVEEEHNMLPKINGKLGIDLGIKNLCITSDGKKWTFLMAISLCLALSTTYELFEFGVVKAIAQSVNEFLGTQGDMWDTQ